MVRFFLAMGKSANFFFFLFPFSRQQNSRPVFAGRLRLPKNLYYNEKIMKKDRLPYPYESAKSRDLCVVFCTYQGTSVAD